MAIAVQVRINTSSKKWISAASGELLFWRAFSISSTGDGDVLSAHRFCF